jgi:hypothetical protein
MIEVDLLSLFRGRCGHHWVGATGGSFGCPICDDDNGDNHLREMIPIAVQVEDWGSAWTQLAVAAANTNPKRGDWQTLGDAAARAVKNAATRKRGRV